MGIEPTDRGWRSAGFEDQEGHQTPFASPCDSPIKRPPRHQAGAVGCARQPPRASTRRSPSRRGELHRVQVLQERHGELARDAQRRPRLADRAGPGAASSGPSTSLGVGDPPRGWNSTSRSSAPDPACARARLRAPGRSITGRSSRGGPLGVGGREAAPPAPASATTRAQDLGRPGAPPPRPRRGTRRNRRALHAHTRPSRGQPRATRASITGSEASGSRAAKPAPCDARSAEPPPPRPGCASARRPRPGKRTPTPAARHAGPPLRAPPAPPPAPSTHPGQPRQPPAAEHPAPSRRLQLQPHTTPARVGAGQGRPGAPAPPDRAGAGGGALRVEHAPRRPTVRGGEATRAG